MSVVIVKVEIIILATWPPDKCAQKQRAIKKKYFKNAFSGHAGKKCHFTIYKL